MMKEIKIQAIKSGVVIDHIPPQKSILVLELLKLGEESVVTVGINFASKKSGRKDVIKIENKEPTISELKKIAVICPDASVSIIRNYEVYDKVRLKVDDMVNDIVKCSNFRCITNNENVKTKFEVMQRSPIKLKCHYCEHTMSYDEIKLL
jgi:aspartate carbamoyltransferase regulatory subunit